MSRRKQDIDVVSNAIRMKLSKNSLRNYGVPLYGNEVPTGIAQGGIDPNDYLTAAKSTYERRAPNTISDFVKKTDTSTVDAYVNNRTKEILIGVRGTADFKDVLADGLIALGSLTRSGRYGVDDKIMKQLVKDYPPSKYTYHLAGHSLGGAIVAELIRKYPFISSAYAFNSASQPKDIVNFEPRINYNFIDRDPLYNLTGRFLKEKTVYPYQSGLNGRTLKPSPLQAHSLNQFDKYFKAKPVIPFSVPTIPAAAAAGCNACCRR